MIASSSAAAPRAVPLRRRIRRALRFRILALFAWPMRRAPRPIARALAHFYGTLAWMILPGARRRAKLHLERAFPERGAAFADRTARRVFSWIALAGCDFLRLEGRERERLLDRVEVEGWEHWTAARASGRGIVLVTGHLGGWELLGAALARWLSREPEGKGRMHVLYRSVEPPGLDRAIRRIRGAAGVVALPVELGLGGAVRALRGGHVVGLLIDRVPRGTAVRGRFFERPCRMAPGAARLALAGRGLILPAALWNEADGGYRVRFFPPLDAGGEESRTRVIALTRAMNRALEEMIRRAPEQWPWFEDRWKERPGPLWGESDAADPRPPDPVSDGEL